MSRMNRRQFTWIATGGLASATLVACSGEAVSDDLTPTQIPDVAGAPPTLAPQATPFESEEGEEATPVEEAAGSQDGQQAAGEAQTHVVEMTDKLIFDPEELTLNVGDTVTWRTTGAVPHTSTCDPSLAANPEESVSLPEEAETWDSGLVNQGEEFSHTFEVPGEYTYFCIPHEAAGMVGYLTVEEGGAAADNEESTPAEEGTGPEDEAAAGGGAEPIELEAQDPYDWSMYEFEVSPGQDIHVVNTGSLPHNFHADEAEGWDIATEDLNGGDEATVTVPEDAEVGAEVVFYCSIPGHREAGMEGTMMVV